MPLHQRFNRSVSVAVLDALRRQPLFKKKLLPDIHHRDWKKRVFPAVRPGRFDFYYRGGRLFEFDGQHFRTHIKYASVAEAAGDYVTEADLTDGKVTLLPDFVRGYERIKENCGLYAGVEAQGVSDVYASSSYACCPDDVVVLDIEVSLAEAETDNEGRKQNRIDLLLFNKTTRTLRFYEAKHYSNPELWAAARKKPAVVGQLKRYNRILGSPGKRGELLAAYREYVDVVNDLCVQSSLPRMHHPQKVEENVVLFVFGYDRGQEARMKELLIDDDSLKGHRLRTRGATAQFSASALWKRVRSL